MDEKDEKIELWANTRASPQTSARKAVSSCNAIIGWSEGFLGNNSFILHESML